MPVDWTVICLATGAHLVKLDHRPGEHDDQAVTLAMLTANLMDWPNPGICMR